MCVFPTHTHKRIDNPPVRILIVTEAGNCDNSWIRNRQRDVWWIHAYYSSRFRIGAVKAFAVSFCRIRVRFISQGDLMGFVCSWRFGQVCVNLFRWHNMQWMFDMTVPMFNDSESNFSISFRGNCANFQMDSESCSSAIKLCAMTISDQ